MKKLIVLLFISFLLINQSNAQLKFGLKGGITSTSIKADEVIKNANDVEALKIQGENASIGFQGGFFGRITIANIYVQPEFLFSFTKAEVKVTDLTLPTTDEAYEMIKDQKFNKIDIPIMVGMKFGPARVQLGPIASIVLSNKSALADYGNYEEEFNGATWGYQVGVGLDLGESIIIDAKYEGSLSRLGKGVTVGGQTRDFDSRPNQFVVGLGFAF
ncbi:MAG: PorT family protein [Bacteroidetes bacterium]|nr:PorT family protein [Bacteroidota bacterium]